MKSKPTLASAIIFSEKIIREAGTNRLSIINSFQKFTGPTVPFAVPPFVVTISLAGFSGEGKHRLSVEVLSPSGDALIPAIEAEVGTEAAVAVNDVFEFCFGLPSVQFEQEGSVRNRPENRRQGGGPARPPGDSGPTAGAADFSRARRAPFIAEEIAGSAKATNKS